MNNLTEYLLGFFRPLEGDGLLVIWAKELLVALLIFGLFWGLAQIVTSVLEKWGVHLARITNTSLDDRLLARIIPHVTRLLVVLGAYLALRSLPLHERIVTILSGLLFITLVVILFMLLYHALDEMLTWYVSGRQEGAVAPLSYTMVPMLEKLAMLFLMGTALIIILKHFGYDIFSLVTALGIGSLAIGMAAKDTLAHMISGFTLMIDRPFRIGDRIQLSGGQVGDVTDIGLRSTKIRTLDNQLLIIPNSDLCNTLVINQAFPDIRIKGRIDVGVGYGSDAEQVKQLLVATALEVAEVLREPVPEAFFVSFGDSALNMSLFFWVEDYSRLLAVRDQINTLIVKRFAASGIEIPFPIRTVIMDKGTD